MKLKQIAAAALAGALVFSLAACAGNPDNGGAQKEKITLCLDWTPNTNHTGIFVALAKGYFSDAGLEVSVVQPPEDGAASVCASGQAQFAIDAQDTIAAAWASDAPLGVTAVAALLQHNTSGILSRKGEGMDKPAGLEGNTYATWNNPIEQAMIRHVMRKAGADYDKVRLIPNNITDEASALKEKQTDAVWVYYAWGGVNAEVSGLSFDYFNFKDLDSVFDYYTPVLIANNEYLSANGDTVKKFLSALEKGYAFAISNPDEAAQILIDGDTTGSLRGSEALVKASQKWIASQYKAEAEQWGYIDPARWDGFYRWLWENKLIEKELPPGTGFTNDYLA